MIEIFPCQYYHSLLSAYLSTPEIICIKKIVSDSFLREIPLQELQEVINTTISSFSPIPNFLRMFVFR